MSDDLANRVRLLEDLLAIQQLYIDYGAFLDAGDLDAYAGLFADDGEVLLGPMGRATGPAAIRDLLGRALDAQPLPTFHLVTSPQIKLHGDIATGTAMWTVLSPGADGDPTVTMHGRHHDEFVRTDAGWRFQRRAGSIAIPSRFSV